MLYESILLSLLSFSLSIVKAGVQRQERHADRLEAAADQYAAEAKAATAGAKEARDAAQRLQHALEAMGFAPKWARAALRVTGREEGAADEHSRRSAALDWLCLHVPLDQMPALLMRVRPISLLNCSGVRGASGASCI